MMSATNQLKAVATGERKPPTIASLLASAKVQKQIAMALPRHMTPERLARIAMTEMRRIPKLQQCEPTSFLGAVIQCAQLGLEPGGALGHAYILPFNRNVKDGNRWRKVVEAQVIIGYRGMIDLARRSGQIVSIDARAVYDGDKFECELGLEPRIEHVPDWENPNRTKPEALRFVYAVAKLKDGGVQFDVMSRAEVDAIRARSKSSDDGPWVTDYAAMAIKTVVRRLFKFLPVSIELQTAVGLDEQGEAGVSQGLAGIIDQDMIEVDEGAHEGSDAPGDDEAPALTFAQLEASIRGAKSAQELDDLAAFFDGLPADQVADLERELEARRAELDKGAA